MAAGFGKDDIEIEVAENTLSVRSDGKKDTDDWYIDASLSDGLTVSSHGRRHCSQRCFSREWYAHN